jgi:hypothetical protein
MILTVGTENFKKRILKENEGLKKRELEENER